MFTSLCIAKYSHLQQVTVFLTAGQVIVLMQLMAALKSLEFQWAGAPACGAPGWWDFERIRRVFA